MIDIYSRYVVGARVHARESGELAKAFMEQIFAFDQMPKVVHADRGTSMTSKPVAVLLADLDVLNRIRGRKSVMTTHIRSRGS